MLLRLAPFLFVVLWSTGFIASKVGGDHAEPFTFLTLRFAIATLLLAPLMLRGERPSPRAARDAAITGALIHTAYIGGVMWALRRGMPAGVVAIVVCLQPLLTSLLAGSFLGERITMRHWLGVGLGLVGAVLVLLPKLGAAGDALSGTTIDPLAVAAAVAALICITMGTLYQKANGTTGDLPKLAFYQYVGATVVAAIAALATEERTVVWSFEFFIAMSWLVVGLSMGAIGLLLMMIRASAVSRVTSLFYLVPAVTALMAWALFGDELTMVQVGGMALVMIAVAMIGGWKRPQSA